jgi:WD40 repeat protein
MVEEWKVGQVIEGLYEVTGLLGRGGMSLVYQVNHRAWGRSLAVKTPLAMLVSDGASKARYIREAQTWVDLGLHPNIVPCWYVRLMDGLPRIFIELIKGGSLENWIKKEKNAFDEWEWLFDIAIQACDGLDYAHNRGVIHRDVKPSNLMLQADRTLLVSDFGIARATESQVSQTSPASHRSGQLGENTNSDIGTWPYQAPEQGGSNRIDRRVDVYSLGVVLFELCCGQRPFEDQGPWVEGAWWLLEKTVPNPRRFNPKTPAGLANLILHCLEPDADHRVSNMLILRERLASLYHEVTGNMRGRPLPQEAALRADSLNNRAVSLWDLGKQDEARQAWAEALELTPHHLKSVYNQGLLEWRTGQIADLEFLRRLDAAEDDELVRDAHLSELVGYTHLERMAPEEAESLLAVTAKHNNLQQDTTPWRVLGWSQLGQEKYSEAEASFAYVLDRSPDDSSASAGMDLVLAQSRERNGKIEAPWIRRIWRSSEKLGQKPGGTRTPILAVAPGDRMCVSGEADGVLRLWDLTTGRCLNTLGNHNEAVTALAFTPDGKRLLSASSNGELFLCTVEKGERVRIYDYAIDLGVTIIRFTPDGRYALYSGWNQVLRRLDLASNKPETVGRLAEKITGVSILPQGGKVLIGTEYAENPRLRSKVYELLVTSSLGIWDIENGEKVHDFSGFRSSLKGLGVSRDGKRFFTISQSHEIRIWDLETLECIRSAKVSGGSFDPIEVTSDGQHAVCVGGPERGLQLWDLQTGRCLRTIQENFVSTTSLALTSDGRFSVEATSQGELCLRELAWECPRYNAPLQVSLPHDYATVDSERKQFAADLGQSRQLIESGRYTRAYELLCRARKIPSYEQDPQALDLNAELTRHLAKQSIAHVWLRRRVSCRDVDGLLITPDGSSFITLGHHLKIWDLETGKCRDTLATYEVNTSDALGLTDDGRYLISGSPYSELHVWDLENRTRISSLKHVDAINDVAVLPNSYYIVSACGTIALGEKWEKDRSLRVWDIKTGECLHVLEGHSRAVSSVRATPDGLVVSAGLDATIRIWRPLSGELLSTIETASPISAVALAGGGSLAVTASEEGPSAMWDLGHRRELDPRWWVRSCNRVILLGDAGFAVFGCRFDGTLVFHDLVSRQELQSVRRHAADIRSIAVVPGERYMLAGSWDETISIWEIDWELAEPGLRPSLFEVYGIDVAKPLNEALQEAKASDQPG